jgi:hypothetical protein
MAEKRKIVKVYSNSNNKIENIMKFLLKYIEIKNRSVK